MTLTDKIENFFRAIAAAWDPNELIGPAGYGRANHLRSDGLFAYRLNFENATNATAPAQIVFVTNTVPTNLNLASLEFISAGFGDYTFAIPPGSQHYEHTERVTYKDVEFDVTIEVKVDLAIRQVRARFESIMPDTGLPPTVDIGFLPPEDGTYRGRGHIAYVVRPVTGLSTGTEIRNIGTITFDPYAGGETFRTDLVNPTDPHSGIDTNRQALVTIDADGPSSTITALTAETGSETFLVSWSGTDSGAGITGYDIYVRTGAGPWELWLENTAANSASWEGQAGRAYGFFAAARDGAGNREMAPSPVTPPQTTTTVVPGIQNRLELLSVKPGEVDLRFNGSTGAMWTLQRALFPTGPWTNIGNIPVAPNGSGTAQDKSAPTNSGYYRAVRP